MNDDPCRPCTLTPDIHLLPESPPQTAQVLPTPSLDMVGEWESIVERRLDLTVTVTTVKGKKKRREEVAIYRLSTMKLCPNKDAIACWTFDKTEPDQKRHVVLLHMDGNLTCDCEFGTFKRPDDPTLCAHVSVLLTLADFTKPLIVPTQPAPVCEVCRGLGTIDDPFGSGRGTEGDPFVSGAGLPCPRCKKG